RRILQGEVGSGKTLVALVSLFSIVRSGYQGAFMAPTEILAEQHFINIKEQFDGNNYLDFSNKVVSIKMPGIMERGMIVALLTGNQPPSEKKLIYKLVNNREIDLVIGTHALFQEDFNPTKLGLVVVDEQHRFGVSQRDALVKKSKVPHLLSMSATPIPRSLALTLYGDLEVSTLRNCPKGRKEIDTLWCRKDQDKNEAYLKIYNEIKSGRQAFIVCPLIHKSEKIDSISVEEKIIDLKNSILKEVKMEVLHGEMNMEEKSEIMNRFKNNEFSLLVATPVIEVGVDIPNATCVIIESADRFGLAQLHQIRGRVGRGTEKSYCYLFTRNISENADDRLNSFEKTKNGFDLAEADLKIRGPGDYIGSKQSGMNDISYEMINDNETLSDSRKWATRIVNSNRNLGTEYNNLREEFKKRFDFTNAGIS
ncbi:MAG: ATP-dependent DNA helicase RecG, partial [Dehalococcoidia bacterium]